MSKHHHEEEKHHHDKHAKHEHEPAAAYDEKEVQELRNRVSELEGMRERLLRGAADFENAKKRLAKERDEFVKFGQESLIRDLLPVMDNFERTLAHAGDIQDKNLKGITTGVELIYKQLSEILKNQGLRRLKSLGEIFDPHQHEAISFVHDPGKEDEIVEEIEPGYFLHDRLLRAAKVKVRVTPEKYHSPQSEQKE